MQNVEFGVVWGIRIHPKSPAMSPFDRAIMTLIETMHLSCTNFQVIVSYLTKVAYFNSTHLHLASLLGMTPFNFAEILGVRKPESLGYRVALLASSYMYSCFDTILQRASVTQKEPGRSSGLPTSLLSILPIPPHTFPSLPSRHLPFPPFSFPLLPSFPPSLRSMPPLWLGGLGSALALSASPSRAQPPNTFRCVAGTNLHLFDCLMMNTFLCLFSIKRMLP